MLRDGAFNDKVVVVTGGGTGLGKAMATTLSELGATVIIASRKQEVLDKTSVEISSKTGNEVVGFSTDVRSTEAVEALAEFAFTKYGKVDCLINNAAGNFISPTERLSHNAFNNIIDIVLKGTTNCTMSFGKRWITQKTPASVVSIVTTYASTGSGYVTPSATAKAGVIAMTRSLAAEWGKYGIRMNAVAPGPFPSKGAWERLLPGDMAAKFDMTKRVPLERVGDPNELANLVSFLLSDYAAYINGDVITIDGGEWLQGAGQFNMLKMVKEEQWDMIEQMIRNLKKK